MKMLISTVAEGTHSNLRKHANTVDETQKTNSENIFSNLATRVLQTF